MKKPLVFISYSWDDEAHKLWVKSLADRLVEEGGVDTIFDQDDCPPGTDFLHFMEQAIDTSDKVLIIMTPNYKRKADERITGVGYETSMGSYEVYSQDVSKPKFIPVLRSGSHQEATPKFLVSKAPVDMRTEKENSFLVLLKAIHGHSDKPTPKSIPDFLNKKIEAEAKPTATSFAQPRCITGPNDPLLRKDPHFLGRDGLVQDLSTRLTDPDCFALTIIGEPGIGKTDLCKAILRKRLSSEPASKVFYLRIEDFDTTDGVRYVMAEALGYSSPLQEKELLIEIAQNPGLYYFDNLESAAGDPTLPAFLEKLSGIAGFQALASSREAVPSWDETLKLNELDDKDACLLFQKIWREKGGSTLDSEQHLFEEFVKNDLGNHPLSITLTAPQGAFYTGIKELIAEWDKIGTAIAKDSRTGLDNRNRSLQFSLFLSAKTISTQKGAIQLWSLAAFFPEGMPPEDQNWFLDKKFFSREDRANLINKNILRNIDGYLSLLPPVARYAEDMLRQNKSSFLRARFFDVAYPWFSELFENANKAQKGEPVWKLIRQFPSIRRFMVFFSKTNIQQQKILKLDKALGNYYDRNPFLSLEILENILTQYKKTLSSTDRGEFHFKVGELLRILSQPLKSQNNLGQALKCFSNPVFTLGKAKVFLAMGSLEMISGNNDSAKSWLNQSILTFEQENDYINKAVAQMQLGYLETRLGNYEEASFMYNQALPIMEKDEFVSNRVDLITLIGELEEYADNHTKANEQYKIAINISEEIDYDLGKGNALLHLGELKIKEKNVEEARTYFNEAMTIFKKVSHKLGEYNTHLLNANLILRLEQNPQAALEHLQKAGAGFEAIGGREGVAEVGFYRAEAYHQMQQPARAQEHYRDALALAEILNIAPLNELAKETADIIDMVGNP